jgi:hypothetical protein
MEICSDIGAFGKIEGFYITKWGLYTLELTREPTLMGFEPSLSTAVLTIA